MQNSPHSPLNFDVDDEIVSQMILKVIKENGTIDELKAFMQIPVLDLTKDQS
jgi:hypothetical protein